MTDSLQDDTEKPFFEQKAEIDAMLKEINSTIPDDNPTPHSELNWIDELFLSFAKRVESMPRGETYGWEIEKQALLTIIEDTTDDARHDGAVGELQRIDVANKDNGINFWFEDYHKNNGWATMRQYVPFRVTQLLKELKEKS